MTLTADQYSEIATGYREAAADPSIPPGKRAEFAKKAEWFRFLALAERDKAALDPGGTTKVIRAPSEAVSFVEPSARIPRRSLKRLLAMLWVAGAAIYLVCTLLFTNTLSNPFRQKLEEKPRPELTGPAPSPRAFASNEEAARFNRPFLHLARHRTGGTP